MTHQTDRPDQQQIDHYLSLFCAHLRSVTLAEREEIRREIGAHIRDSVEQRHLDVPSVLAGLGSPEDLADQYRDGALIGHASRSLSPILLLRGTLRLATKGFFGIFVLACGVFGYATGVGMLLTALIKPFAPAHTGTWLLDGHLVSSGAMIEIPPSPAHEVLGWWYIPVALAIGAILLALTTILIRLCLRISQRWQARLGSSAFTLVRYAR